MRVDKGNPKTIKSGDLIELAAEADGEHKQVVFVFTESAPVPQPPQAPRSGDSAEPPSSKRQRLSIGSVQLSTQSQTQPNGQTSEPTVTIPNASGDASLLRRREAEVCSASFGVIRSRGVGGRRAEYGCGGGDGGRCGVGVGGRGG